jgi:hypothetical protein
MPKSVVGFVLVAAMLVVGAPGARASGADPLFDVIPFSGSGTSGTIDPGIQWSVGDGLVLINEPFFEVLWPAPPIHQDITDFHITFTDLPAGVTISSGSTFLQLTPSTDEWPSALSNHTITFTAPPRLSFNSGDNFSSLIILTPGHGLNSVHFSGAWSGVPEPGTMLLFGTGLLLLGTIGRKLLHA